MNLHNRMVKFFPAPEGCKRNESCCSQRLRKARKNNPPMAHDLSSYFCLFCFEQISL